jgi:hypothetical protein
VNEKRIRDAAVLGALHGIVFEDEVEQPTDRPPRFDGGVRGDAFNAPRPEPPPFEGPSDLGPGWREVEIEDGADLFFGELGER